MRSSFIIKTLAVLAVAAQAVPLRGPSANRAIVKREEADEDDNVVYA